MNEFTKNFTSAKLSDPISIGGLKLYPINFDNNKLPFKISTFDQLYDIEKVEANEIGEEGIVSKIEIHNKSDDYLVIFDGEAIIGAKQNRISEQTVILLPNSKTIIPVNCVERGRWNFNDERKFSKSNFSASPKMRSKKAEMLKEQRYERVQSEVWNEIDMLSEKVAYSSDTADLGDVLKNRNTYKFNYDKELINKSSCNGYLVFGTEKPFIELFFDKEICKKQIFKSIDSWFADIENGVEAPSNPEVYLDHFLNSNWDKDRSIGIETSLSSSRMNNGRSTFLEGNFIHSYYYF